MKNLRKLSGLALALLGGAPCAAWAQGLAIPAGPAAVAGPAPALAAAPVPAAGVAAPRNLWTFLCPTPAQKAACKAKFCGSQFGQLINNSLGPVSAFTGGVLPQVCPLIDPANLLQDPGSALGAAARIQKDTAEAAARRAAIRYMSTADCNWWPEATAALSNTLRADRNECVRMEAGFALQRGCCCNPVTIKALVNALSVFPDDGNPPEDSPRVRGAAMAALEHCLACYVAIKPVPPPPPPPPPGKELIPGEGPPIKGPRLQPEALPAVPPQAPAGTVSVTEAQHTIRPASYRAPVQEKTMEQLVQEARVVLQQAQQREAMLRRGNPDGTLQRPLDRSLIEVIDNALRPSKLQQEKIMQMTPPPQAACEPGIIAAPPMLRPVPQGSPPMPAAYPSSIVPPVRTEPVSLGSPQPSAAPSTTANSSYAASASSVSATPSQPPSPPVRSTTTPTDKGSAERSIVSKPSESNVRIIAPQSVRPLSPQVNSTPTLTNGGPTARQILSEPVVLSAKTTAPLLVPPTAKQKDTADSVTIKTITTKATETALSKPPDTSARISPPLVPPAPSLSQLSAAPLQPVSPPVNSTATSAFSGISPRPTAAKPVESYVSTTAPQPPPARTTWTRPASAPSSLASSSYANSEAAFPNGLPSRSEERTVHSMSAPGLSAVSAPAAIPASVPSTFPTPANPGQPPTVSQLLALLMSSESPNTRQWAAQSLTSYGERSPTVVQTLVSGASTDASDDVRDACLQSLLQLGVSDPVTLAKADWPLIDGDPRVREAVWRHVLFGTEARDNPRVHEGTKALNEWLQSRPSVVRLTRS